MPNVLLQIVEGQLDVKNYAEFEEFVAISCSEESSKLIFLD